MQAHCQIGKYSGLRQLCDFSELPLDAEVGRGGTVQGFSL